MPQRALFLFPTDRMGGAERITRTLAIEAARSKQYGEIHCYIHCLDRTGTLDDLEEKFGIILKYSYAKSHFSKLWSLFQYLLAEKYDLVFSSHLHFNAVCSLMRRLGWLRVARLISRESTMAFERDFGRINVLIPWMYAAYGAQDIIVCQTPRMRDSLSENTAGKYDHLLKVLPNPIDMEWVAAGRDMAPPPELDAIPAGRSKILWCGRLSPVKSPFRAINALHALHRLGRSDIQLVMVGDGPLRAAVSALAAELGMSEYLTMIGHHAFPSSCMARCNVGLLTSDIEGFPNVILEMLASGIRSVVSTDCADGLGDIPGVSLVSSKDEHTIAQALLVLLENHFSDPAIDGFLSERSSNSFFKKLSE
ncbi:glycosyltransferase [Rhizorhabdus histidinilytica]|uniref:glycosyltransferase n=1 Tax=Rhizorhabdus histidinilytica TaxID=439228 RepID=UPI001ADC2A57|nr:glycosyltransferase [Rhizorhabdus histidinilytica]